MKRAAGTRKAATARKGLLLPLSVALLAQPGSAIAAQWSKGAGLGINSFWSSNICRAPTDEKADTGVIVSPRVNLAAQGARARMNLLGALEYNSVADSDPDCGTVGIPGGGANFANREPWIPRLNFNGELEALEDLLFLEADAFASQNPINPFVAGGEDNINGLDNTNITYRWGAGARIEQEYGTWRNFLRYRYNEQSNSANRTFGDSQEDRVDLDVGMIPGTRRLTLGLRGNYSEVTFDETALQPEFSNRLARLELRSVLQLSDSWQLTGSYGQEDNVFLSTLDDTNDIDGSYWDAGLRWAPNPRVTVTAGYGERFFGETPRFAIQYRHKRSSLSAQYLRTLQFPRNIRAPGAEDGAAGVVDPGIGGSGEPLEGAGLPTFVGQGPVLNERFLIGYRFNARRTNMNLTGSYSEQTRASDGGGGEFFNITAGARRNLGSQTSIDVRVTYLENRGSLGATGLGIQQAREQWRGSIGLNRRVAQRATLTLRYEYTEQSQGGLAADPGLPGARGNQFEEHRVTLGLQFSFGQGNARGGMGGGGMNGMGQGGFAGGGGANQGGFGI